jgi:hypothetical protein
MTTPICGTGGPPSREACSESHCPDRPRSRTVLVDGAQVAFGEQGLDEEVTVFLFCSVAFMTAVCGGATSSGTPTTWGF